MAAKLLQNRYVKAHKETEESRHQRNDTVTLVPNRNRHPRLARDEVT